MNLEFEGVLPTLTRPLPADFSAKFTSQISSSALVLKLASMAPAKVPVAIYVDWLEAGPQATVAVLLISLVYMGNYYKQSSVQWIMIGVPEDRVHLQ